MLVKCYVFTPYRSAYLLHSDTRLNVEKSQMDICLAVTRFNSTAALAQPRALLDSLLTLIFVEYLDRLVCSF